MNKRENPRYQALLTLLAVLPSTSSDGKSLSVVLAEQINLLNASDRGLSKFLCYGVLRHYFFLSALVNAHLTKVLKKKDADIFLLLQAACFEFLFSEKPPHAIVSEWVELCALRQKPWAKGLVNAILRSIQRKNLSAEAWLVQLLENEARHAFNHQIRFEHPSWMIEKLKAQWPAQHLDILAANNQQAPMILRVNTQHCSAETYLDLLATNNLPARISPSTQNCIYLEQACDINLLPGFSDGWVSVQDEAAQQAAFLLDSRPGHRVLDACSAPGGKAAHILELQPTVALTCIDNNKARLPRITQNLQRLGLHADVLCADAGDTDRWWDGQYFDRILLDAPCSASGIIRRHPDIKLLRQENDIERLVLLQKNLLARLWLLLKPQGVLLYATCSIFKDENQNMISSFLEQHPDARLKPSRLHTGIETGFGQQLFAQINGHDGFFYAVLAKTTPDK